MERNQVALAMMLLSTTVGLTSCEQQQTESSEQLLIQNLLNEAQEWEGVSLLNGYKMISPAIPNAKPDGSAATYLEVYDGGTYESKIVFGMGLSQSGDDVRNQIVIYEVKDSQVTGSWAVVAKPADEFHQDGFLVSDLITKDGRDAGDYKVSQTFGIDINERPNAPLAKVNLGGRELGIKADNEQERASLIAFLLGIDPGLIVAGAEAEKTLTPEVPTSQASSTEAAAVEVGGNQNDVMSMPQWYVDIWNNIDSITQQDVERMDVVITDTRRKDFREMTEQSDTTEIKGILEKMSESGYIEKSTEDVQKMSSEELTAFINEMDPQTLQHMHIISSTMKQIRAVFSPLELQNMAGGKRIAFWSSSVRVAGQDFVQGSDYGFDANSYNPAQPLPEENNYDLRVRYYFKLFNQNVTRKGWITGPMHGDFAAVFTLPKGEDGFIFRVRTNPDDDSYEFGKSHTLYFPFAMVPEGKQFGIEDGCFGNTGSVFQQCPDVTISTTVNHGEPTTIASLMQKLQWPPQKVQLEPPRIKVKESPDLTIINVFPVDGLELIKDILFSGDIFANPP